MKQKFFLYALFILLIPILSAQAVGIQTPQTMSYQGILTTPDGALVSDGVYKITFKLYTASQGGRAVWTETQSVEVKNGLFNAALGSVSTFNVPFDQQYWLGVTIGENSEAPQRIKLTSSAYSLHARSVADSSITRNKIAKDQVVKSINSMTENVNLVPGENITITQDQNSLIISMAQVKDEPGSGKRARRPVPCHRCERRLRQSALRSAPTAS